MASDGRGLLALALGAGMALAQGDTGFLNGAGVTQVTLSCGRAVSHDVEVADVSQRIDVEQLSSSLYVSHGIGASLDVTGSITWIANDPGAGVDLPEDRGLQDGRIGLRWRFAEAALGPGRASLLLTPTLQTPLRDYATDSVAAIGNGETTLSYGLVAQYRWNDGPFLAVEGRYLDDLGTSADAWLLGLAAGHRLSDRWSLAAYGYRLAGTGGDNLVTLGRGGQGQGQGQGQGSNAPTTTFDLGTIDQSYSVVGVSLQFDIGDGPAIAAGWFRTIQAENVADSDGFSLSLSYSFGG